MNEKNELAAPQFRGIGIRIEDDVLITETSAEVLTEGCPRDRVDIQRLITPIY